MPAESKEFSGKFAAVTGSAREKGFGSAIVIEFAERGAEGVVLMSRGDENKNQAERIMGEVRDRGSRAVWFQGDLTDENTQAQLNKFIKAEFGQLDALVNNAAVLIKKPFNAITRAEWDYSFALNVRTPWELTKTLLRLFPREGGAIVNIGSAVGPNGNRGQLSYVTTKASLPGFSRGLAIELARRNIRINVVNPGFAETDMTEDLDDTSKAIIVEHTPLGRFVTPGEVAFWVVNLCSPHGSSVTGATLDVDGGISFANIGNTTSKSIETARRGNNANS